MTQTVHAILITQQQPQEYWSHFLHHNELQNKKLRSSQILGTFLVSVMYGALLCNQWLLKGHIESLFTIAYIL